MFFRKRANAAASSPATRLFGGKVDEAPASIIGKNTRFRGEVRGGGLLVIRGYVEGSLQFEGRVSVESGSSLRADVQAPQMVLAGDAQGEIRIREVLSVRASGTLEGHIESGRILVEEGAVLRGTIRRIDEVPPLPPEQSTP